MKKYGFIAILLVAILMATAMPSFPYDGQVTGSAHDESDGLVKIGDTGPADDGGGATNCPPYFQQQPASGGSSATASAKAEINNYNTTKIIKESCGHKGSGRSSGRSNRGRGYGGGHKCPAPAQPIVFKPQITVQAPPTQNITFTTPPQDRVEERKREPMDPWIVLLLVLGGILSLAVLAAGGAGIVAIITSANKNIEVEKTKRNELRKEEIEAEKTAISEIAGLEAEDGEYVSARISGRHLHGSIRRSKRPVVTTCCPGGGALVATPSGSSGVVLTTGPAPTTVLTPSGVGPTAAPPSASATVVTPTSPPTAPAAAPTAPSAAPATSVAGAMSTP